MGKIIIDLEKDDILFRDGDSSSELFLVHSGKLMACIVNGTEVKPLAFIHAGEVIGEFSYFDNRPLAAHIIAVEESQLIQIPQAETMSKLPDWFKFLGRSLTKNLRIHDKIIHEAKIRKTGTEDLKLSIEEQRYYYEILFPKNQ